MPNNAQLSFILVGIATLVSGCAGVTRLPARAKGPAGENLQEKKPDIAALDAPGARREDVVKSFASIDTGYQNPRVFWARWSDSKWGYWWIVAGNNSAAGDAGRFWHAHNLLVSFAEDGTIRAKQIYDDSPSFWVALHAEVATSPALDFSEPIHLSVYGSRALHSITLTKTNVLFEGSKKTNPTLQLSPRDIVRFSHNRSTKGLFPGATCHNLEFAARTSWGKRLLVCASPPEVATLFRYMQQEGAPALRWD